MKFNIEKLRKKRKWTGKEVGLALIANTLNDIKYNGQEYEPLFSQEFFTKMEKSIDTEKEYQIYGVYRCLYSAILDSYNTGLELYQQFYNGYSRLENMVKELVKVERTRSILAMSPFLVTEKQYNDLKEKALSLIQSNKNDLILDDELEKIMLEIAVKEDYNLSPLTLSSFNGIAIIKTKEDYLIDTEGYYIYRDPLQHFPTIKALFEDKQTQNLVYIWQNELVYSAISYFYAYNTLLKIIENIYEIDNLSNIASLSTTQIESEIQEYNKTISILHESLSGDHAEQKVKSDYVHSLFKPLLTDPLHPSQEDKDRVHQNIANLAYTPQAIDKLKYFDEYLFLLSKGVI